MIVNDRSAELSNALFQEKVDRIAKEHNISPEAIDAIKQAAEAAEQEAIRQGAFVDDKYFYRGVLIILGSAVIITAIGGLALSFYKTEIPQFIVAIGTTALGAVAGLLAPSPVRQ